MREEALTDEAHAEMIILTKCSQICIWNEGRENRRRKLKKGGKVESAQEDKL